MKTLTAWKKHTLLTAACLAIAVIAQAAQAVSFNYQAKLSTSGGSPLEGNHTVYFALYHGGDAGTANSGTLVYSESKLLTVDGGVANHLVGTGTPIFGGALAASMFDFSGDIFLQVAADVDTNVVLPRAKLAPVPFAINALNGGGTPVGFSILADEESAPAGYTYTGNSLSTPGHWTQMADMPTSRSHAGAAVVNGKLYVIGGYSGTAQSANEEYDPATNTWTSKAPMTTPRMAFGIAVHDNKIYAIGGTNNFSDSMTVNEQYDPLTNAWIPRSSMPSARYYLCAATAGNRIYAIGGVVGSVPQALNQEYDPATNTWSGKQAMPTARSYPACGVVNGKVYVAGGLNVTYRDENEEYDPATNTWEERAPMSVPRAALSMTVFGGRLYAMGGTDGVPLAEKADVEEFDVVSGLWSRKASLPAGRIGMGVAALGDYIYAAGGGTAGEQFPALLRLDPGVYFIHKKD